MKIVVDSAIPYIENRIASNVEIEYVSGNEITPDVVKDADALIVRTRTRCDANLLEGSKVKLVATATIGTDHIDLAWCEKNGVIVRNAPGCNAPGVAQYVFASIFKAGFDLGKDKLGVIGHGHVGSVVAEWAKQMGIETMISDAPRKLAGYKDVDYYDMEEVLAECGAVTLHVPLTTEGEFPTSGMIGESHFRKMKDGAILVNSSRGGIVDEGALKFAILQKKIKAVIDVWKNEPDIDQELLEMSVIATPHIAGYSVEGKKRGTCMVLRALSETFKTTVDLSGLECETPKNIKITRPLIESSYNPLSDTLILKSDPSSFEPSRNHYTYRHEPLFKQGD